MLTFKLLLEAFNLEFRKITPESSLHRKMIQQMDTNERNIPLSLIPMVLPVAVQQKITEWPMTTYGLAPLHHHPK